jgi:DHA2 family multidrug resistance protein
MMARFNLNVDFNTIFIPRVVLGVGMGFLFIPLTTMTMSGISKEEMGNATGIFNLLRNLGGSFGVAFITTMLARRAQFHQVHLVEHLTPFDRNFQSAVPQISQMLQDRGVVPSLLDQGSLNLIYGQVIRQASMLSFNDVFQILSIMMMLVLPLVLLMKKGKADVSRAGMH